MTASVFPLANGAEAAYSTGGLSVTMKMTALLFLFAAITLAGCSRDGFSSGVKVVSVNTTPRRPTIVLSPERANSFSSMAKERNGWVEGQLRTSITRELAESGRFQPAKGNGDDGQIVFNSIRHGLLEVSANNYAAQLTADVSLVGKNGKTISNRDLTATAGQIHTLAEFEDSKTYEEAMTSAADKLALELVHDL